MKNATLQELHGRAKELIAQLEWFSIDHALREHNREADDLANQASGQGHRPCGGGLARAVPATPQEFEGVVQGGGSSS